MRIDNSRDWARALLDGIAVRSADAESSAQLAVIGAPTGVVARSAAGPSAADYRKLDTQMTGLLDTDPEDYRAYRHRAFARWQLGRTVSAVKDAKNAVRLAPKDVLSQSTLIGALVDAGRPKEAIEAARLAFEAQHGQPVDPALATLYHARSRAWAAVQEDDHELDDLARAAELQPDVYGSLYEHAKSVHAGAADLDRLLPEDSLTQTVLVVALAASVLIPLYLITSWWSSRRRAPRSLRISSPKKAIFAPRRW